MGAQCTRSVEEMALQEYSQAVTESPVYLHLYDLGTSCAGQALNKFLRPLGSPAFHCGVEVFRHEWSYCFLTKNGEAYQGSGVFSSIPRECEGHSYSQSVRLGTTVLSQSMFSVLIKEIEQDWPSYEYDILARNCCHFANELCLRLGVGTLPDWVMRLSDMGTALAERQCTTEVCCTASSHGSSSKAPRAWCCQSPGQQPLRDRRHRSSSDPWQDDVVMAWAVKSSAAHHGHQNGSSRQHLGGIEETLWDDGETHYVPTPRYPPSAGRAHTRSSRAAVREEEELQTHRSFTGYTL